MSTGKKKFSGGRSQGDRGGNNKSNWHSKKNVRRGGPGILLTCETGREFKAQREGLEILRHYYYRNETSNDNDTPETGDRKDPNNDDDVPPCEKTKGKDVALSLEEEIAMLKNGANSDEVLMNRGGGGGPPRKKKQKQQSTYPFAIYETGCRGTVFVMCALPKCALIPAIPRPKEYEEKCSPAENGEEGASTTIVGEKRGATESSEICSMQPKRQKLDELKKESESKGTDVTEQESIVSDVTDKSSEPPWDPMGTMNKIVQEIRGGKQASDTTAHEQAPSSRFVTRMIPMQATCFASLDEISLTAKSLMERFLLPPALDYHQNHHTNKNMPKQTFDIVFKRRNCSNVTRDKVIDVIAPIVMDVCKVIPTTLSASETQAEPLLEVKLKNSDYTIIVEVCRTLCGISIVPNSKSFRNFNLIEIRQEIESKTGDDKSGDY